MKKGKVIEEGTHESLLDNEDGAYWALGMLCLLFQHVIQEHSFEDLSWSGLLFQALEIYPRPVFCRRV